MTDLCYEWFIIIVIITRIHFILICEKIGDIKTSHTKTSTVLMII